MSHSTLRAKWVWFFHFSKSKKWRILNFGAKKKFINADSTFFLPTFRFNRCTNLRRRIFSLPFCDGYHKNESSFSRGQTRIFFAVVNLTLIQNEVSFIFDPFPDICINSTSTKNTRKIRRYHWYAMCFQRTILQIRVMYRTLLQNTKLCPKQNQFWDFEF